MGPFRGICRALCYGGKTCIKHAKASPCAMSKSTTPLVIVGNAFERERRAAQAVPKRVMWQRDELGDLLNVLNQSSKVIVEGRVVSEKKVKIITK